MTSRILVVDDQSDIRVLLRDLLQTEGYEVLEAVDGPSALAMVDAEVPDLVLLDHMIPEITGIDVLARLRLDGNPVPVILLSAYGDDATTWQGWTSGASLFLDKPFDNDHLLQWVARLLEPPADEEQAQHDLASHRHLGDPEPGGDTHR